MIPRAVRIRGRGLAGSLLLGVVLPWALPSGLGAQETERMDPREEARLLREATARESVGDFQGAERTLLGLLERNPTSPGALFALDRVLRAQGRPLEVLRAVDAFLDEEPAASGPRYLKLRILDQADSVAGLEEAAGDWMEADPRSADPYREISRVFENRFGPERALEVLRRGRSAISHTAVLAVEMGDLLAKVGELDGAAEEWALAMGEDATQFASILRRVEGLEGEREAVAALLVERLTAEPTTEARRRAAAQIAVEAGLDDEAVDVAGDVLSQLEGPTRRGFLADLARRAEGRASDRVALWAYQAMRAETGRGGQVALDARIADAALALGDTTLALEARERVADAYAPETPERRRALARLVGLEVAWSRGTRDARVLDAFRREFPAAPELDALAAGLAGRLQLAGDSEAAREVLEGVEGPRSALERAYLDLEGDPASARMDLVTAVTALDPVEATEVIQLVSVLNAVGPDAAEVAARVAAAAHRGDGASGLEYLDERLVSLPEEDRPPLLAQGARVADGAGLHARGARLRESLIEGYPAALEAPEAMLALARFHGARGGGTAVAAELLERLILESPESAVVPDARRELQRLRGRAGGEPENRRREEER